MECKDCTWFYPLIKADPKIEKERGFGLTIIGQCLVSDNDEDSEPLSNLTLDGSNACKHFLYYKEKE